MGVTGLNSFIRTNCTDAIRQIPLYDLKNKKIVVDTSIYMYRFATENALIEKMYQMIMLFKHHAIIPVFVFDGKAPREKEHLLKLRKNDKINAEHSFNTLKDQLKTIHTTSESKEINSEMDALRKKFVRLSYSDIDNVKKLMELCGVTYYQAEGEADKLCAKLVMTNEVYACLSEDNDMFVYGCQRVLRNLSLLNSTIVIYDLSCILQKLHMNLVEFKQVCVLSGTDYNYNKCSTMTIVTAIQLFINYKNKNDNDNNKNDNFYNWLIENNSEVDLSLLNATIEMFNVFSMDIHILLETNPILNKTTKKELLHKFLDNYNFIFA
jgi:flap endonuclease-1